VTPKLCAATAVLAVAAVGAGGDAEAARRHCNVQAYETVTITSARNMTCRAAKRDLRASKDVTRRRFTSAGGFHCKRIRGGTLAGEWRCVRGSRAYRYAFGD
jgi:hypothetical protein